jgi:hypothetical protein
MQSLHNGIVFAGIRYIKKTDHMKKLISISVFRLLVALPALGVRKRLKSP